MACVRVTDKGLLLCTCRFHDNGSSKLYVHVPHNPHGTIPSPYSDQLTPAIFSPKPFRGMKAKYSSHTWQMRCVQGGFSGLSSFSLTTIPKWNIKSDIHANLESLYYLNRPDLKAFISTKYARDPLSVAPLGSLEYVPQPSPDRCDKALAGATYVSLQQSLEVLHSMKHTVSAMVRDLDEDDNDDVNELQPQVMADGIQDDNHDEFVINDEGVQPPELQHPEDRRRNVTWPLAYAMCQSIDSFGSSPCLINAFNGKFLPLLWAFIRLLSFLPPLWKCVADCQPLVVDNEAQVVATQHIKSYCAASLPLGRMFNLRQPRNNRRQKPAVIQRLLKERASTVHGLIPDQDRDDACLYTSVLLARILHTLPYTCVTYKCSRAAPVNADYVRQMLANSPHINAVRDCRVLCICTDARVSTARRTAPPEHIITCEESKWELVAMLQVDGTSASPWEHPEGERPAQGNARGGAAERNWNATCYLRNEGPHESWFKSCRRPMTVLPVDHPVEERLWSIYKSWGCLIYVRTGGGYRLNAKLRYLQYTGGQRYLICHRHNVPLTIIPIFHGQQREKCCYTDDTRNFVCNRVGKWSCSEPACICALCSAHGKQLLEQATTNQQVFRIHSRPVDLNQPVLPQPLLWHNGDELQNVDPLAALIQDQDDSDDDDEPQVGDGLLMDPDFDIMQDGVLDENDPIEQELHMPTTNAADIPVMQESSSGVSGHILLNKHFGLLRRPGHANYVGSKQAAFFQRMTARFAGASIPLLYPEGMLFPSIFWKSMADGTVIGALPHCFWTNKTACKKAGFADLSAHIKTRLMDPTLLTSTDPRVIQFYFDALFNLQLSRSDTRIILSRGWEHLSPDQSMYQTLQTEGRLPFGEADSRKRVNELAAEIAKEQPTYFYTHSCNQSEHFGVKPIFDWIDNNYRGCSKEVRDSAVQASLIPMVRAWERASTYLMNYIKDSPEQPLGPVKKLWWRWEFQTTRGNLPHIHALVWTGEDPESDTVRNRVTATLKHSFHDWHKFRDAGLVQDFNDVVALKTLASKLQEHSCEKAGYRCAKKRDSDGKLICRFPQRPASEVYSTKTIYVEHSETALKLLRDCNLAEEGIRPGGSPGLMVTEELRTRKHMYPAQRSEHLSPFNDWIFAAAKSSDNLQICSPNFTARYLAKYAAGEEERARVFLKCGRSENEVSITQDPLHNLKVTGAAIASSSDKAREKKSSAVEGRTLALTEVVFWEFEFEYVHLCSRYIHINTGYKQDRSAIMKREHHYVRPGAEGNAVAAFDVREALGFPRERQILNAQISTICDARESNIMPDAISIFAVRPPELLFISSVKDYFECVDRKTIPKRMLRNGDQIQEVNEALLRVELAECPWIDGFDKQIRLLPNCISRVRTTAVAYVTNRAYYYPQQGELVRSIIRDILEPLLSNEPPMDLVERFVVPDDFFPRVAVLSNPLPRYADRFLIHIILSMGRYETEVGVFDVANLRQSFQEAQLIADAEHPTVQEKNLILRRYILEQLVYMPGGTVSFDRHLVHANNALYSLLIEGDLQFFATPLVLRYELVSQAVDAVHQRQRHTRKNFAEALHYLGNPINGLPPVDDLVNATLPNPLPWIPVLQQGPTQSAESFQEQQAALQMGIRAIDEFRSGQLAFVRAPILLGPPGSGKSFITAHWGAYALAKGLNTIVTSVASERAAALGGEHIHLVFSIPVSSDLAPRSLAERALTRLARDPVKMEWLRSIRVFIHEEIGTEGAETLNVQNKILQFLHKSPVPFGGVLIMESGDPNQLPPITETLIWTSPSIITTMRLMMFQKFVRSATDRDLQEVLTLFQKLQPTDQDISRIQELIDQRCQFKDDWDQVPPEALQIFGRHKAEYSAIQRQLDHIMAEPRIVKVVVNSLDQYTLDGGHVWSTLLQERLVKKMNRKLQTPQSITLYIGAVMRFTCNDTPTRRLFHQSQLCVVRELPVDGGSVGLWVAPPGRRTIPPTEQEFRQQGWTELRLPKMFTISERLEGSMLVRREQYPIRHYIASTIHKIMGDTLGMVATQISVHDSTYKLWLKSQLYVIISRVREMNNIIFVGPKRDIMDAIKVLLVQSTQWDGYVRHVVGKLSSANAVVNFSGPPRILFHARPFRPRDTPIPNDYSSYVYLLVSTKYPSYSYIGQTNRLARRVDQHNEGEAAGFTSSAHLIPWGVYAYVVGFRQSTYSQRNERDRQHVEHTWDATSRALNNQNPTPQQVLDSWDFAYRHYLSDDFPDLVLVQCGDL